MNNILKRAITGSIYVASLLWVAHQNLWIFGSYLLLVLVLCSIEFEKLLVKRFNVLLIALPGYLMPMAYLIERQRPLNETFWYLGFVFILFFATLINYRELGIKTGLFRLAHTLLYLSIPFASLVYLQQLFLAPMVILIFACIWSNDTGAYLVGMAIGKHPLARKISPKKTVEGFIGGLLFSLFCAFAINHFYINLDLWTGLGLGVLISVASTFGDLYESHLKRKAAVKDSGNLFIGHGGFLDRFDSVLFAAPLSLLFILIFN